MRRRALAIAREALGREPEGTFPTPWNPFRWIAVAPDGDARLVLPIDVAKKKAGDPRRFAPPRPDRGRARVHGRAARNRRPLDPGPAIRLPVARSRRGSRARRVGSRRHRAPAVAWRARNWTGGRPPF